jgi:hypothetical protein
MASERRDLTTRDRRTGPLPRDGGRRATDPQPSHGTRARYQAGCRERCCRAAEAQYRAHLRTQHAKGLIPLGAKISATEAHRRIKQLLVERFSRAEIARRLGLKQPKLRLHTDFITVRNVLKIRRLYRLTMLTEGPDQPYV